MDEKWFLGKQFTLRRTVCGVKPEKSS